MPGHNHYADCSCGWCYKAAGATIVAAPSKPFFTRQFGTIVSFTDPNATCPVCGAAVFFYRSPHGGRVFFDELGPPWPKHPCTSSEPLCSKSGDLVVPGPSEAPKHAWQIQGWRPVEVIRCYREDDWHVAAAAYLDDRAFVRILFPDAPQLERHMVVQFKGWDADGLGRISYLDASGDGVEVNVFAYAKFIFVPIALES